MLILKFIIKLLIGQIKYQNLSNRFKKKYFNDPNKLYFMAISKCAGTNLFNSISNSNLNIVSLGHRYKLPSIGNDMKYIFSYREPSKRMFSAFYHIKNCGKPRDDWKKHNTLQKILFFNYNEFNLLAEDLCSKNILKKFLSRICMNILFENHPPLSTWFNINNLKKNKPIFIFDTNSLNKDLEVFNKKFNLNLSLSKDPKIMNKGFIDQSPGLSDLAKSNLKTYLAEDYKIYTYLNNEKVNINYLN